MDRPEDEQALPPGGAGGWSAMRASDAERERVAAALRHHFTAGRLSLEELSDRLDRALSATTFGELYALTEDLPHLAGPALGEGRSGGSARRRRRRPR